jgi:bifunctional enzyme CysN/CysC
VHPARSEGLYAKAKEGLIRNFTGIDSPYEAPEAPELHLETVDTTPDDLADRIVDHLAGSGRVGAS